MASIRYAFRAIYQSLNTGLDDALKQTWQMIGEHTRHPDNEEGPRARVEKREPQWVAYTGT